MQINRLKFQTKEKVNKKISQGIDRFFGGRSKNPILEMALENAIFDKVRQIGISVDLLRSNLSR